MSIIIIYKCDLSIINTLTFKSLLVMVKKDNEETTVHAKSIPLIFDHA